MTLISTECRLMSIPKCQYLCRLGTCTCTTPFLQHQYAKSGGEGGFGGLKYQNRARCQCNALLVGGSNLLGPPAETTQPEGIIRLQPILHHLCNCTFGQHFFWPFSSSGIFSCWLFLSTFQDLQNFQQIEMYLRLFIINGEMDLLRGS